VVLVFFAWTASNGNPFRFDQGSPNHRFVHPQEIYYNFQVDAFLQGQVALLVRPLPQLLALSDPYDPAANAPYRIHDLALYHGRYYLTWGPTPALTSFLPWRLLPFGELPSNLAVVLYAWLGLVFALLLARFLIRRFLPGTPRWMAVLGAAALALSSTAPFLLPNSLVYEVALSCGYCFLFAGLWLLATGALGDRVKPVRLAGGSACIGLAAGARPPLGLAGALCIVLLMWLWRTGATPTRSERLRLASALLLPLGICATLLLAYNYVRFGSVTEFGLTYQLAGEETMLKHSFRLAYLPPGLWYYLFAPPRFTLAFPFFHLPPPPDYPFTLPDGYTGLEHASGIFTTTPITLLLPLGAIFAVRHRGRSSPLFTAVVACLALLGLVIAAAISVALWGATERYELDFAPLLLIAALLVWWRGSHVLKGRARTALRAGGAVLVAVGCAAGAAFPVSDSLRAGNPGAYRRLESVTSWVPMLGAALAGHPLVTAVRSPLGLVAKADYTTFTVEPTAVGLSSSPTEVDVASAGTGTHSLRLGLPQTGVLVRAEANGAYAVTSSRAGFAELPIRLRAGVNHVRLTIPPNVPPQVATGVKVKG
jgi:hypothetical protein